MKTGILAGVLAASCVTIGLLPGCGVAYRPYFDEGGSGASIDEFTYVSEAHAPKTITVVDTRTGETVFSMDVPVGQQLVMNFEDHSKDKGEYMSGTMRWKVMPAGQRGSILSNRTMVPPPNSRRIDMALREGPEVATPPEGMSTGG